jgi:hypothetical protein
MSGSGQGSSCCRLLAVATLLLASTGSRAATYFECRDAGGGILYSDLPCPDGDRQATTEVRREVAADNVITGGLDAADRAHLERIERDRAASGGGTITGLPDPARVRRCEQARQRLDAHRARARRPHKGSLRARGRDLRRQVRDACH